MSNVINWSMRYRKKNIKRFSFCLSLFCCFLCLFLLTSIKPNSYNNSENIQDNLIYKEYAFKSSTTPVLIIDSPFNYTTYGEVAPNFSLTIVDGLGSYLWYEFLETGESSAPIELNGIPYENITETFNQKLWSSLTNGIVTIRFYVVNSLGKVGQEDAIIRIDIIDPTINTLSPKSYSSNLTTLGFIVQIWMTLIYVFIFFKRYIKKNTERFFFSLLLLCYFLFFMFSISTTINFDNNYGNMQDDLIYEEHSLKLSTAPTIQINSPINYNLYGKIAPNFSITIVDGLANYSWYEFIETGDSSVPIELKGILNENITGTFNQSLWSNLDNGTATIRFYVNNTLGEIGQTDVIVRIDIIDPTLNIISPISGYFNSTAPDFEVEISDPNLDKMWYTLNSNPTKHFFESNESIDQNAWINLPDGLVTINFFANDSASNEITDFVQVTKDREDPLAPSALAADPISWTNIDNFNLTWSNPSDTSSIVGVYYKLDVVPTSDTDGTYVAGTDIESLIGITVSTDGVHDIYLWLVDAAGNINYSNYISTQLYLDTTEPDTPSVLIADPISWTNIDSFNLSWSNPSDTSSIAGVYYKLDSAPTSNVDGIYVAGTDIESLIGISVVLDGVHTVYIWLVDTAGNTNYSNYESTELYLDTADPAIPGALTADPVFWTNIDSFNLSWSNPSDTSGIAGVYYKLDAVPTSDIDGTYVAGTDIESLIGISAGIDGVHTVYIWLVDTAGNTNYSNHLSTQLYLDTTEPDTPSALTADPVFWTNIDSFNLSWSNPSDTSGIAGIYYKLDSIPTSDIDGTYIAGSDIESLIGITVGMDGVHNIYLWLVDTAGNTNYSNHISTELYLDTTDPAVPSTLIADPFSWTNSDSFNLSWSNPSDTSGIVGVYYKLDAFPTSDTDGTYVAGTDIESLIGITVGTDGVHTVYIWLVDTAGNVDYGNYKSTELYLDTTEPDTSSALTADPVFWTNIDYFNLTWLNPSDTSGIVGVYYKLDAVPTSDTDGTYIAGSDIESLIGITVGTDGVHTVYIWLVDAAGNFNYNNYESTELYLDTTDPAVPSTLIADPVFWTNIDNFNLTWSNPSDTSGIAGVYYKLDSAPTSNVDGIYVAGTDIESLIGITVGTDGVHTLYIWLVDSAGNTNYSNHISTELYLDTADPAVPSTLIADPISWTNIDYFNLTWSNPSDTSGIIGVYYKLDAVPTSDTDGTYIAGSDIESLIGIIVGIDGVHTVYIWLVDTAGNVDYGNYESTELYLDATDPVVPSALTADPVFWTNIDYFNLSWTNPSDTSGIAGVYYKFDAVPTSDTDGTYIAGSDIESLIGITVGMDGVHTVYIWLVDTAGNTNYINHISTELYLDTADPASPGALTADPVSWTNIDYFNLTWSNPSDTSGIAGVYYKLDAVPTSDTDGTYIAGSDVESLIGITVGTDGVHSVYIWLVDTAGNIDYGNYESTELYLDTTDPAVPGALTADPVFWTNIDYFNLTWSNPSDTSGIAGVYYKLDSIPTSDIDGTYIAGSDIESLIGITVGTDGVHTVYIWLVDTAGNINYSNHLSTQLYLDTTEPDTPSALTADPVFWTNIDSFNLSWSNPSDTSGIAGVYYKLDSAPTSNVDGIYVAGTDIESLIGITVGTDGVHTVYIWLVDTAGNVDYGNYESTELYLDATDPIVPSALTADPVFWTNIDYFNLTWLNPSDTSGIVGVYYKLDAVPTSDTDGTYIAGSDIESLIGITVGTDGVHTLYIWLVDAAGNFNYNNYESTELYLDTTDPAVPSTLIADPISWTNSDSFNLSWSNPSDTSGIIGVYYKLDAVPTSDTDGTYVAGTDIESFIGISVGIDGVHTLYIWLVDAAGNVEYNNYISTQLSLDTTDPTGSIEINDGDAWTTTTSVVLSLFFDDITSGVLEVRYSNDSITWTTWEPASTSKVWVLPTGDSPSKIVYYEIKDNAGLISRFSDTIGLDTEAPIIIINLPLNNSYWDMQPIINVSAIDLNLDDIWYRVGIYQRLLTNNTEQTLDIDIWNSLDNGQFEFYIWAIDNFNQISETKMLILYKDTQAPQIDIISPSNISYWNSEPQIQITASDPNFDSVWYTIQGTKIMLTNGVSQLLDSEIWNNLLAEQQFIINIFANDTFGHVNGTYQLTLYKDIVIPTLEINSPGNNTLWNSPPQVQITASDIYFDSVWYVVSGTKIMLTNGVSESLVSSIWASLPDESSFTIYFYANDSAGNINNTYSLNLHKDILAPRISILFPQNDDLFGNSAPDYFMSINELYLNQIWYTLDDGITNFTITEMTGTINQTAWDLFGDGNVIIRFYANDLLGKLSFSEIIVRKDVTAPIITITLPSGNDLFSFEAPNFTIYKDGIDINTTWYTLDNGVTNYTFTGTTGIINQAAWDLFGNGTVTIRFYINDSMNNIGYDVLTVRKDIIAPTLTINSPTTILWWDSPPPINISAFDPNLNTIWYRVGTTNITLTNNIEQLFDALIWSNLPQGEFKIYFYAIDDTDNLNETYITLFKDTLPPVIIVISPENCTYWNVAPSINILVYDPNFFGNIWYSVSGYSAEILLNNTAEDLRNDIWISLEQGEFVIRIYCSDSFGNLNEIILILYKDTIAPKIIINSPDDQSSWNSPPILSITASDPNLNYIWYRYGTDIFFIPNNTPVAFDNDIWNSLIDGPFTIEIYANDSFGNLNNTFFLTLYKDMIPPGITVNLPINESIYNEAPKIYVSTADPEIDSIWYRIYSSSTGWIDNNISISIDLEQTLDANIWDSLNDEETFQIYIYANDTAGNINDPTIRTLFKDIIGPRIEINDPGMYDLFGNNTISFNLSTTDSNLNTTWYSLYTDTTGWSINVTLSTGQTDGTIDYTLWQACPNGTIIIRFYSNDTLGNIGFQQISIYKDSIPPNINIVLPESGNRIGRSAPEYNINIEEPHLYAKWYILINATNILDRTGKYFFTSNTGSISLIAWYNFGDGNIIIRFYANDSLGNENYAERMVIKDITAPDISIEVPSTNYELFGQNAPNFILSISGNDIDMTWYILINATNSLDRTEKYFFTGDSGTISQMFWDSFRPGYIIIQFFINDTVGNSNQAWIYIKKVLSPPTININLPSKNIYWNNQPLINISSIDLDLASIWYRVNSSIGWSEIKFLENNLNQFLDIGIWDNLEQGKFQIYIFANDSYGNVNDTYVLILFKDTLLPNITIISPQEGDKIGRESPLFELSILELNLASCCYSIIGTNTNITFTGEYGRIDQDFWQTYWDNLTEGERIIIRFWVRDVAGNIGFNDVEVVKFISEPFNLIDTLGGPIGLILTTGSIGIMVPINLITFKSRFYKSLDKKGKKTVQKISFLAYFILGLITVSFII